MIDTHNNSLVEQFAQVRETLRNHHDSGCFVYLSSGACDCGVEPNTASLAALSAIERHVQEMAEVLAIGARYTEGVMLREQNTLIRQLHQENLDRMLAALSAREKEEE